MKIAYKTFLYESTDRIKYLDQNVELYHGTGEDIKGNLQTGSYDNVLWFTTNTSIAQSYIKCGNKLGFYSKTIAKPIDKKHTTLLNIQKQLGIEYEYSYNSFGEIGTFNAIKPKLFNDIYNVYLNYQKELTNLTKQYEKSPNQELKSKIENIRKLIDDNEPTLIKIKYVEDKLKEYGYTGESDPSKGKYYNVNIDDNNKILPASYKKLGKLYIAHPKRKLKLLDISTGMPNENKPQYHYINLFKKTEERGFDGIIIDDLAQFDAMDNNIPHLSYGIFKSAIKDLSIDIVDACNLDYYSDNPTNNYIHESTDLPFPTRGATPIPNGYTRMYHQTNPKNIPNIIKNGLLVNKSKGSTYGEPIGIWASNDPKGFYGNNPDLDTVEFKIPTEEYKQLHGNSLITRDVPPNDIIAIHSPWKDIVNYLIKHNEISKVKNGEFDDLLDDVMYRKAIQYIKTNF